MIFAAIAAWHPSAPALAISFAVALVASLVAVEESDRRRGAGDDRLEG